MKYQSEIIKEIIDTRGHEKSSLHYESECIEKMIEETKGAYPKLCDYEGEWLDYCLENDGIGEFPYLAIDNISSTTIENTVPIPFKSAVLKGSTKYHDILSNKIYESYESATNIWGENKYRLWSEQDSGTSSELNGTIVSGTDIVTLDFLPIINHSTYKLTGNSTFKKIVFYDSNQTFISSMRTTTTADLVCNNIPSNARYVRFSFFPYEANTGSCSIVDENNNPINFRQIQLISCKMPVLTTTGKNLLNPSWEKKSGKFYPFKLKKGTTLTLSTKDSIPSLGGNLLFTTVSGREKWFPIEKGITKNTIILDEDVYQVNNILSGDIEYQLEIGSTATSYEPYQSSILTVNEDVELRGVGEVKDELNLLTGELTQRIGEIVLDGSENWYLNTSKENTIRFQVQIHIKYTGDNTIDSYEKRVLSSQFPTVRNIEWSNDVEKIESDYKGRLGVRILKSKLSTPDINGFKSYLQANPLLVQYELATHVIKTVDLTITNQDGETLNKLKPIEGTMHLSTSGENIKPLFSGEIPVEAITQNLASFIDLETEA